MNSQLRLDYPTVDSLERRSALAASTSAFRSSRSDWETGEPAAIWALRSSTFVWMEVKPSATESWSSWMEVLSS